MTWKSSPKKLAAPASTDEKRWGFIFRMVSETLRTMILVTDPEKVRETLELFESEPEIRGGP